MKRILLFVNFNKENELEDRTVYTLKKVRHLFETVFIISNSGLSIKDRASLGEVSDKIIMRDNVGFDFAAWKTGIDDLGWDRIKKYDSLTLMNDTCYSPIWPIDEYFEKFEKAKGVDFWGASVHIASSYGMPGTDGKGAVPEHIQSYFMTFKKKVVASKAFANFWDNIKTYSDIERVIRDYEVGLTRTLNESGFTYDAIINNKNAVFSETNVINPVHQVPALLLKQKFPFIKIKAVSKNNFIKIRRLVNKKSDYPARYINIFGRGRVLQPFLRTLGLLIK